MKITPQNEACIEGSMGKSVQTGSASRKRVYSTPSLERLGDIRALTLGGSPGNGDSGISDPHDPLGSGSMMDRVESSGTPLPGASPAPQGGGRRRPRPAPTP